MAKINKPEKPKPLTSLLISLVLIYMLVCTTCPGCTLTQKKPESQKPFPQAGDPAIDFLLPDLQGHMVDLKDYEGQVILLNFWTTRCRYCVEEMDLLETTHLNNDRMAVVTINVKDRDELLRQFMADKGFTFPVLLDQTADLFLGYGLSAFPSTIIIDEQGIIASIWVGALDEYVIQQFLETARTAK